MATKRISETPEYAAWAARVEAKFTAYLGSEWLPPAPSEELEPAEFETEVELEEAA